MILIILIIHRVNDNGSTFQNEPGIDFSVQENVDRFNEILKKVKGELGQNIPLFINGEK